MPGITAAVGKGVGSSKGNFTGDVGTVQAFLNNWIILGPLKGWVKTLTIDGMIGPHTIEAIEFFQASILGWKHPDGRIDVGGQTAKALFGPLTLRPELDPSKWKKPSGTPKPISPVSYEPVALTSDEVLKLKTGGDTVIFDSVKGANVTIRSGEAWQGPNGDRLVLAGCSTTLGDVHFMQISTLGPGLNLGGIYRQNRVGFQEDLIKYGHYGELVRKTDKILQLMRTEMYIMMGAMSVVGGTPVMLWTIGTSVGEFIGKNQSKFPKWVAAVSVALVTRKVLKTYAPTLYDKLIDGLLLGTWKGLKIVTLAFGTDIASKIPEAMISDEEKLAKASGALIGKLGKNGWTGKTAVARVVLMVLQEVATHAIKSIPVATAMKATEIVDKLKAAGVSITQAEGEAIILEVAKHAAILLPEIIKLKEAVEAC